MKRVLYIVKCAWCDKIMRTQDTPDASHASYEARISARSGNYIDIEVSHGICKECVHEQLKEAGLAL